jgi:hypothetical protein
MFPLSGFSRLSPLTTPIVSVRTAFVPHPVIAHGKHRVADASAEDAPIRTAGTPSAGPV